MSEALQGLAAYLTEKHPRPDGLPWTADQAGEWHARLPGGPAEGQPPAAEVSEMLNFAVNIVEELDADVRAEDDDIVESGIFTAGVVSALRYVLGAQSGRDLMAELVDFCTCCTSGVYLEDEANADLDDPPCQFCSHFVETHQRSRTEAAG